MFYSTSYNLYAPFGFVICLLVNLTVSLLVKAVKACRGDKGPFVEPVLLHPLVRHGCWRCFKSRSSSPLRKGSCPRHPFNSLHFSQAAAAAGSHTHRRQQGGWSEDSHYRWPSPSLPPTLKKGTTLSRNNNNYEMHQNKQQNKGTLDHGRVHERAAIPVNNNSGREYYNLTNNHRKYGRGRGRGCNVLKRDFDDLNQSEEILDEFGDVVVVRTKSPAKRTSIKTSYSHSRRRQDHHRPRGRGSSDDDDDGWTTEF